MRFDTLAATAESAVKTFVENDEPEVTTVPPAPVIIENYNGFDIYEIESEVGPQYYTEPALLNDGEIIFDENNTTYSVEAVKDEIDRMLAAFDDEIPK